ncbi:hypothetical protein CMU30_13815 [Elizabethkingia anophelis]|nr:hypothetical protein [Elizabethkingia anophelis]MDV3684355.1 hypothetical protein [Elizabethkingia anophelis]MDV3699697.1 hypothetical protein [Elizabethkingia anophelis]MDV3763650.1 hypothetical protein [Elizabethkingia anophelis]MDV3802616.1 hypothetical protein [Elizabethkingia anophelis]
MAELNVGIGADISELVSKIDEVKKKVQDSFKQIDVSGLEDAFKSLETSLRQIGAQNEIFGKSLSSTKQELNAYTKAFNDLIAQGLRPTHPEVLKLADEIDRLNKEIDESEKKTNEFSKGLNSLIGVIGSLGLAKLASEITAFGKSAVKSYADMESMELGLQTVMGSSKAAKEELEKLREVAKLPGLSFKEAVKGSVNLQAAGFSADLSRRSLMAFGNALASVGKGGNELGMVNLALSQLQNKSSGFGQDIRQLTEQLPQLKKVLTEAFGTADTEAISKMGYTGEQVVEMLIKGFEKLPPAITGINNAFENAEDSISQATATIGKEISQSLNLSDTISGLSGWLNDAAKAFGQLSPEIKNMVVITGALATAIIGVTSAIVAFSSILPVVTSSLAAMGTTLGALTGYIGLAVAAIGAITYGIITLTKESREATARQEAHTDAMIRANSEAKKEITTLDNLISTARNEKESREKRTAAIKELQSLYPNYFGNLTSEQIKIGNLRTQYKLLTSDILASADARAAGKLLDKAAQEKLENEVRLTKERNKYGKEAREIEEVINKTRAKRPDADVTSLLNLAKDSRRKAREAQNQLDENNKYVEKNYAVELKIVNDNEAAKTRMEANAQKAREIQQKEANDKALKASKEFRDAERKAESEAKKQKNKEARDAESEAKKAANREKSLFNSQMNAAIDNARKKLKFEEEFARDRELLMQKLDANRANYEKERAANRVRGEEEIFQAHKAMIEQYDEMFQSNIADSISNFGERIGEAMANGTSLISAAGAGLLSGLGSFSQMLGKEMIKLGVKSIALGKLMITIKEAIKNPWALVAAGIAAIAIGGILNSAASNTQNNINSGSGGSSGVSTSTSTGANTTTYSSNYGGGSSSNGGTVVFRISGNDLVGVLEREQDRRSRIGS